MKSDDLGKAIEAERTALHALLFEHRQGLALADIAVELGLTEERAEELLRTQEVRQLVRSEVDEDEGVLRYVTLRVSPPSSDAKSALASLIAVRSAVLHARRRARAAAVSVVATVLFAAGGWFALRHLADASGGSTTVAHPLLVEVARAPLARADEQASVSNASAQRRAWIEEANDIDARVERLEGEAIASVCITRWTLGEPCYVSHRLMTRAFFDDERGRMTQRAAQLRGLVGR
jgi:hypothetical protein